MVRLPPHKKCNSNSSKQPAMRRATAGCTRPMAISSSSSEAACSYWQVVGGQLLLYRGPLGEVVGQVPDGTVLREVRRYRDPFGGWWVASRATDGTLVWVMLSSDGATEGTEGTAYLQRVYNERTPAEVRRNSHRCVEAMQQQHSHAAASLEVSTVGLPSVEDSVLRDLRLLESCWTDVAAALEEGGGCRDWNAEYQVLVESVLFDVWENSVPASEKLRVWMEEFSGAAEEAALVVVADMVRPSSERVAKSARHPALGAFLHNNLLVRVAIDDASGDFNGDAHAWKRASQAMHGLQLFALEGPKRFLYTTPSAVVTFSGLRFCVTAIPPVRAVDVVYLPLLQLNRGLDPPNFVKAQAIDLGLAIGLKQHEMKLASGEMVELTLPADVIVVAGRDKRLYIMNALRVLPALAIVSDGKAKASAISNGTACVRFRAEFLLSWSGAPMNCNAFLEDVATPQSNSALIEATEFVRDALISKVAGILGLQQAVDLPLQNVMECRLCSGMMENELRFVVCRNVERCCCVCAHCYTKGLSEAKAGQQNFFAEAVKCGSTPRGAKGLLLEPSVSSIFHANGLNMCFLPFVYHRMTYAARFAMAHYCEVDMLARGAVSILREKLRHSTHAEDDVKTICHEFFLGLLQSSGPVAERFWAEELGPTLERMYGLHEPFDTSDMDVELLYNLVAQLSGVYLDDSSIASLRSEKPFLQLAAIKHQTRSHGMPQPPVEAHAVTLSMVEKMSERLDRVSQKVDAIYDLLLLLVPQPMSNVRGTSPSLPLSEGADVQRDAVGDEDPHVACVIDNAAEKHHHPQVLTADFPQNVHQSNATVVAMMTKSTTAPTTAEAVGTMRTEELPKDYSNKKTSVSVSGRHGGDGNWMKRDCFIVLVEFKCQRVKRCESSVFIVPGQYAIVQGDRGHDCGVVNQCSEWSAEKACFIREESFDGSLVNVARMKNDMGRVLRVATEAEVELLFGEIARNENLALKSCREIVSRLKLDMDVVDCEYQFDQQKISFYYEASRSIDFRQLNSELYRIFGVRIWLQNVNNAVKNVVPAGAMSRDDKAQYQKSGLRHPTFK